MAYLDPRAAYEAAIVDFEMARSMTEKIWPRLVREQMLQDQLAALWQARVDRGELPPLFEKAS